MYEELVKKLRYCGNAIYCSHCPYWEGCGGSKENLNQAAYAIEELQSLLYLMKSNADWLSEKIPQWIPVTERLPEENGFYLCLYESKAKGGVAMDEGLSILQFINKKWSLFDSFVVTHWLPIPEPPKEET